MLLPSSCLTLSRPSFLNTAVLLSLSALLEDRAIAVADAYWRAWELGLKGITIFRYGSKSEQVLELGAGVEAHYYDHASKCDPEECKV